MHQKSIFRQVALVSYGAKFLCDKLTLEKWYQHGIFFGARLQFRALADNGLLADDFTLWLGTLKQLGAFRLSLHRLADFDVAAPCAERGGDYIVVAHYTDYYQLWVVGEERAPWWEHPILSDIKDRKIPLFPDATYYGGDLDSYWCIEERQGHLDVLDTDWKEFAAAVVSDLDLKTPWNHVPVGPFFAPQSSESSWAKLPLFPSSWDTKLAHSLLAALHWEQSNFDNYTQTNNDASDYKGLDDAGVAAADAWGKRLDSWTIELLLRCANEYWGPICKRRQKPKLPVHKPESLAQRSAVASHQAENSADADNPRANSTPKHEEQISRLARIGASDNKPGGIWASCMGVVIVIAVIAVIGLMIVALVNIIAAWPWLPILIGVLWAFYANYKNK